MAKLSKKKLNEIMNDAYHICREEEIRLGAYDKCFVVYSFNKDVTVKDINAALKNMHVSARELSDEEVIYHI